MEGETVLEMAPALSRGCAPRSAIAAGALPRDQISPPHTHTLQTPALSVCLSTMSLMHYRMAAIKRSCK
jgi:hypothetical protein